MIDLKPSFVRVAHWWSVILEAVSWLAIASILALLVWFSGKGLEFTDSSYYISWARYPTEHKYSLTWFGYITHILYLISFENIKSFTIIGISILFVVSILLSSKIVDLYLSNEKIELNYRYKILLSIFGASFFVGFYSNMILYPNYNWLSMISVILVSIGLLKILALKDETSPRSIAAISVSLGVGIVLSIFAKFTTALAIGLIGILFLLFVRPPIRLVLQIAGTSFVVMLGVLAVIHFGVGDLSVLINDTFTLQQMFSQSGTKLSLLGTLEHDWQDIQKAMTWEIVGRTSLYAAVISVAAFGVSKAIPKAKNVVFIAAIAASFFCIDRFPGVAVDDFFLKRTGITVIFIFLIFSYVYYLCWSLLSRTIDMGPRTIGLALMLAAASYAAQYGSQNDLRYTLKFSFGFLVLLAIVPWIPRALARPHVSLFFVAVTMTLMALNVWHWPDRPYRLHGKTWDQTVPVNLPLYKGVQTDAETAAAVKAFLAAGREAGLERGGLLVDMTGASPYAHLLFETRPLSAPWVIGGEDPRREKFAELILSDLSQKERRCAWVLHSDAARAFKPEFLKRWDLDLKQREKIASFDRHLGGATQYLYKPKHCPNDS